MRSNRTRLGLRGAMAWEITGVSLAENRLECHRWLKLNACSGKANLVSCNSAMLREADAFWEGEYFGLTFA